MKVTLLTKLAMTDIPIAHAGTERRATKYDSVEVCLRPNHLPIHTSDTRYNTTMARSIQRTFPP